MSTTEEPHGQQNSPDSFTKSVGDPNFAVEAVARKIIAAFRQFDVGPLNDINTLKEIARLTHCKIDVRYGCSSRYEPIYCNPNVSGLITVDGYTPLAELIADLGHELGHHSLEWWDPNIGDYGYWQLEALGNREEAEERICRRVAELVRLG